VEEAPQYILGYTIGNELTARLFQDPKKGGRQYSFAKYFDNFAPLGPVIVNSEHFGSWGEKTLKTAVNGRIAQDSPLDLIWGPAELVSFLSQGAVIQDRSAVIRKWLTHDRENIASPYRCRNSFRRRMVPETSI
jgi:2-keto-4-pentenoate hydratase/2-oxohepta-3-ene-1,7-dioic acid hydratase in catechol pathway